MAVSKKEKMDYARGIVIEKLGVLEDFARIDSGAFIAEVEGLDGEVAFVEVKIVVKGEGFDISEAMDAYADKLAKARERDAEKARKAEERALKEAVKVAKAIAKSEKSE